MKGEQQAGGTAGYLELFRRNRDFRLLFAAQVVSYCGDWFLTVALLDLVLRLTGSATLAGLLILCQTLPMFLCAPWAGTVVDRYDRRRLMIALDVGRIGLALLPIAAHSVELLPLAYVSVVGISVGAAFFSPAMQAAIPNVVTGEELGRVNVLMGSTWGTMLAVGSALGGIVAGLFGVAAACVFDAGTFAISALALWAIRRPFQQQISRDRVPLVASLREAAAYAREHPRVLALLTCKGGFGVGAGAAVLLSVFATTVFQSGAWGVGVLYSARGVGAMLGPFVIRALGKNDESRFRLIGACGILYGLGYTTFALSPYLGLAALAVMVAHLGGGAQWATSSYGLQREVPDALRGRIFAADFGLVTVTTSLATVVAGVLADAIGAVATAALAGTLALSWGLFWGWWTYDLWATEDG